MNQNAHNTGIMESSSTSTSTKDQKDCEVFMAYGSDHTTNLSKQYQGDGVGVCGSLEECLEEWGCFRQYMYNNYQKLKHTDVVKSFAPI